MSDAAPGADPIRVRGTVAPGDILEQLQELGSNIAILATIPNRAAFWDDPATLSTCLVIREEATRAKAALEAQVRKARAQFDDLRTQQGHYAGNVAEAEERLAHYEDEREAMTAGGDPAGRRGALARVGARGSERRLADLEGRIRVEKEAMYRAKVGLEVTTGKLDKVRLNVGNMEFVLKHFLRLYDSCFEDAHGFTNEVLGEVAATTRDPRVRDLVERASTLGMPSDLSTMAFDWPEFIRRFDLFLVRNVIRIQGSIVAPRKETLLHIRKQQMAAGDSIKAHMDSQLRHKRWLELSDLLVEDGLLDDLGTYRMFSDRVRVFFMTDAVGRMRTIASNRILHLIYEDMLEFIAGDISRGFSTFGKDAGFNPLMRKIGGFYVLYQWRSVNVRSILPRHPQGYAQIDLIHVYDAGVLFVDHQGTEVDHPLHPEARQLLKEIGRDLLFADAERGSDYGFGI